MNAEFILEYHFLLLTSSVGLILIITGYIHLKFPPKKINHLYGYRTKNSMKNQERWDFAQHYSAKELMKTGGLLILIGLPDLYFQFKDYIGIILGLIFFIAGVIYLFFRVEAAIKKRFN